MTAPTTASSARNLFTESKARLSDRIQVNVNSAGSVAKQVVRGSKSNEVKKHSKCIEYYLYLIDHKSSIGKPLAGRLFIKKNLESRGKCSLSISQQNFSGRFITSLPPPPPEKKTCKSVWYIF